MNLFKTYLDVTSEVGFVKQVIGDIVYVNGLPGGKPSEIVIFETGDFGQIMSLQEDFVEVLLFARYRVKTGLKVTRTGKPLEIPVGAELLSNIISPFGTAFEAHKNLKLPEARRALEGELLGIAKRKTIKKNLETGVSLVDLMIPLGQGQRQLIIGDRKTGKSAFLLQTILAAARRGTICIYAAIGKKKIDIKKTEEFFVENKIMDKIIIVASTPQDPPGVIHLTPYSAMTMAEYFRDLGKDTLVVLDDLSTHARFYREISLLAKRFPGRNSYPPDIFYIHARLLERAGNFSVGDQEASITCLPVAETLQGDLSGFIQTNIMSMTDGHIFFDNNRFYEGRRPAINEFLSVTRVGLQTQTSLKRSLGRELLTTLTLYQKMQNFVHFGAELSQTTKETLRTGGKITQLFNQGSNTLISSNIQMIIITLFWAQKFKNDDIVQMNAARVKMETLYQTDAAYKKVIDDLIDSCATFNQLLKNIESKVSIILKE